jgi:branched-chain amino acid transport system permease protein
MMSIWFIGYLIIGGLGSIPGCFFGVIIIILLQEGLTQLFSALGNVYPPALNLISATRPVCFGIIVALFLIFEPRGIAHRWDIIKSHYRSWPFAIGRSEGG